MTRLFTDGVHHSDFKQRSVFVFVQSLSCVQFFVALWTVAHQAPLPWDFPVKNTGVGCHFLLQRIFPTQGLNSHLLQW